jgi:hypothetical protein
LIKKLLATDIISVCEFPKTKLLTRLAWDGKRIIIFKGKKIGHQILRDRYWNKEFYLTGRKPKHEYLSAELGEYFITHLCYGIIPGYVWASKPYKISHKNRASRPMKISSSALAKYNARTNHLGKIKSSDGRTLNKSLASVMSKIRQLFKKREKFKNDRGQPSAAASLDIN